MVKPRPAAKQDFKSLRGLMMVDSVRGRMRVRIWPRKRGKPKAKVTRAWNGWFKDAARLSKFADAKLTIAAMDQTKNTGLYPRDVIFRAMSVGIADLILPDGQIYQHGPIVRYRIVFQGAIIRPTANIVGVANAEFAPNWPLPVLDTLGFWSSANPGRFTIPAGITVVEVHGGFMSTIATSQRIVAIIRLNGGPVRTFHNHAGASTAGADAHTGPMVVSEGDFIELKVFMQTGNTIAGNGASFFSINVLQMEP